MSGDVTAGYIVPDIERLRRPMQQITDYLLQQTTARTTPKVVNLYAQPATA